MVRFVRTAGMLAAVVALGGVADAGELRKGPYLQNTTTDSVTVMWETAPAMACAVELRGPGGRVLRTLASDKQRLHEIAIDGLAAARRYRYQVVCEDGTQDGGEFATAPATAEPFTFVVFGDSRSNAGAHRAVVERVRREVPDFMLGTGDMVNQGHVEEDWQEFFEVERELLRDNVLFPSLGNHDRQGKGRTADNYRMYFSVPENSPDPERYYAFTYGSARVLVLDSNAYSFALSDQTDWIESQLQAARMDPAIRHIFVTMHHPPYSTALHGGQTELRDAWTPLFEKYQVAAVFSGHDHCYERAEHAGVRYFVSGGGGAPLYPRSKDPSPRDVAATKYFERVNHYLRVHVVGDYVEVSAFRVDGSLIESVTWGERPRRPDAVRALAVGAAPERAPAPEAHDAIRPPEPATGARFGATGVLGAGLMLLGGALGVWIWRRG